MLFSLGQSPNTSKSITHSRFYKHTQISAIHVRDAIQYSSRKLFQSYDELKLSTVLLFPANSLNRVRLAHRHNPHHVQIGISRELYILLLHRH